MEPGLIQGMESVEHVTVTRRDPSSGTLKKPTPGCSLSGGHGPENHGENQTEGTNLSFNIQETITQGQLVLA